MADEARNPAYRLPNGVLYEIHDGHGYVETIFPGGGKATGVPSFDLESVARARALGYEGTDVEAVWAMTRDHDLLHNVIAHLIDGGESHALHYGQPRSDPARRQLEERLVFLVQRALNSRTADDLLSEHRVRAHGD